MASPPSPSQGPSTPSRNSPPGRITASSILQTFSPTRSLKSPAQMLPPRSPYQFSLDTCEQTLSSAEVSPRNSVTVPSLLSPPLSLIEDGGGDFQDPPDPATSGLLTPLSPLTCQPRTPSPGQSLSETDCSPSVSRFDSRTAGQRSLRARESLALSTKAKANLERGIKDPREFPPIPFNVTKPKAQPQDRDKLPSSHDIFRQLLKVKQDSFLWTHRDVFLPLLPRTNHVTRISEDLAKTWNAPADLVRLTEQPSGVKVNMKRHQLEGLSFLLWLRSNGMNGILGDEMGLGKTLQALSLLQHMKEQTEEQYKPSLVVCPLSVLATWQSEASKFTPDLKTTIFHGLVTHQAKMRKDLRNAMNEKTVDVVLVSYETYDREQNALRRHKWSYAILDEGHKVKNADSKVAQALRKVSADHRLLITGTPIQNDLFELWSLLHWLLPGVFDMHTRSLFEDSFALCKQGGVNMNTIMHARKVLELIMLRRTKEDVEADMKLPDLKHVMLSIPLSPKQREVYKTCITKTEDEGLHTTVSSVADQADHLENSSIKTHHYRELLNLVMQLRKVAIHPYLMPGIQPDPYTLGPHVYQQSGKFVVLRQLLLKLVVQEKKKVIIFSGFKGALDCVEDLIQTINNDEQELDFLRIDGDTQLALRNLSIMLFQEVSEYPVMLASLRSGGFGITLTAAEAVIFLDQDWNPQVTIQAAARAHRMGQSKPVTVYNLLSAGTVEEQMEHRIAKKMYLASKVTDAFKHNKLGALDEEDDEFHSETTSAGVPKFSLRQLASIVEDGKNSLGVAGVSVGKMLEWDFEQMLSHCEETRTVAEMDEETQEKWLQKRERTETAILEGITHKRVKKTTEDEITIFSSHEERRVGKETTVMVDGYSVLKSSIGCKTWEAVPTLVKTKVSVETKSPGTEHFGHFKTCTICQADKREELFHCQHCPNSFHSSCLQGTSCEASASSLLRLCPAHRCCECLGTVSSSGGLLYRCTMCPRAFCEENVEWNRCKMVGFKLKEYLDLGYDAKQTAFYVVCKHCNNESPPENPAQTPAQRPADNVTGSNTDRSTTKGEAAHFSNDLATKKKKKSQGLTATGSPGDFRRRKIRGLTMADAILIE